MSDALRTNDRELPSVLFAGCGEHGGNTLLPALVSLGMARVVGVCDLNHDLAFSIASRFGVANAGTDLSSMLDQLSPEAVIMAGTPRMHTVGGSLALSKGKHLLVEKPPARNSDDLLSLSKLAYNNQVVGMVGHNLRYSAAWQQVLDILANTQVEYANIAYVASGPRGSRWGEEPLVAFLLSHVIHAFDLALACVGSITTSQHRVRPLPSGAFTLSSEMVSASGTLVHVAVSTVGPRFILSGELHCRDGRIIQVRSPSEVLVHSRRDASNDWQSGRREIWRSRSLDAGYETAGYGKELGVFIASIQGRETAVPSFKDELQVYRLMDEVLDAASLSSAITTKAVSPALTLAD